MGPWSMRGSISNAAAGSEQRKPTLLEWLLAADGVLAGREGLGSAARREQCSPCRARGDPQRSSFTLLGIDVKRQREALSPREEKQTLPPHVVCIYCSTLPKPLSEAGVPSVLLRHIKPVRCREAGTLSVIDLGGGRRRRASIPAARSLIY